MNINFNHLPYELKATIFSYFTVYEAYHVLQWVCKDWKDICSLTYFKQQFFVSAYYKIFCFDLYGKEEYCIDWYNENDRENAWLTGITLSPNYDLLVCDYFINGIHRFIFNINTWRYEYDSIFWQHPNEDDCCPEYILCHNKQLYIAADSPTSTLMKIDENKQFSIIYSNNKNGFWGMTKRQKNDTEFELLCCLPRKVLKITLSSLNNEIINTEEFIKQNKYNKTRLGCIAFAPNDSSKPGQALVLDSFGGRALLYSDKGDYMATLGQGKHLERSFDIVFINRNQHPFKGIENKKNKSKENIIQSKISVLIFSETGILEYNESGQQIRTINTNDNSLKDCNFVHTTALEI